ncbi:MAG: UDP-N-acetylmuramoyl-L-alanyl-D-glutamate--2,6-diaminopimelate ligase [Clostridia bacterium]|nr:UDP-N-acetylmuramoyl-L-alanyl-D-glutamate--2,6-diaminopimelate ligase [Clostridia bacterium]
MKFGQIIKEKEILRGRLDALLEINEPRDDSRKVKRGDAFFSVDGKNVADAVKFGAAAVVYPYGSMTSFPANVPCVAVGDVRHAYAVACQRRRGCPGDKMKLVAVTGTNGKTSTSMILRAILTHAGHKTAVIGTTGNFIGESKIETAYTTPPPDVMAELLEKAANEGAEYVVTEASSHALDQRRLDGLRFEVGIFTNLTRDHLDYHKTIEACAAAKARLFETCGASVINLDDVYAKEMARHAVNKIYYCSKISPDADFFADDIELGMAKIDFSLHYGGEKVNVASTLTGGFYVYNITFAVAAAIILGVNPSTAAEAVAKFGSVEGRMESYKAGGATAVIDYAHTPDALEKALSALRPLTKGKLFVVFGCGGDRDKGKRPMMGEIAAKYADAIVLTSDNPRSEDPEKIIEEISGGIPPHKATVKMPDRAEAIRYALSSLGDGDVVLVAGKGHEDYMVCSDGKHRFSDREQIEKFIERN